MSKLIYIYGFHSIESLLKTNPESILKVIIETKRKDKRVNDLIQELRSGIVKKL